MDDALEKTIADREASERRLSDALRSVADRQDWRPAPDQWSFREIAAHLDVCQRECVLVRVQEIASGSNPQFDYYRNTGRDFGPVDLQDSLRRFTESRAGVHDFMRGLTPAQRQRTGRHQGFGAITAHDYLKIDLEHDQGHLGELEQLMVTAASKDAR
jgi:hypothetical protein